VHDDIFFFCYDIRAFVIFFNFLEALDLVFNYAWTDFLGR